ncbi:hypothetical protein apy_07480 [Aeropyrum pernix]|uniref:ABC transporter, permease protein n=1 Tax=Aeropyrum pernix TaxID=56636 RepID=A0A401H9F8_AERPX|nr:hypothetical protein [Aeropyrum pernix]GBF09023.1 hypothetical protein apy_07480 [Aeropyrum pernix]
MAWEEAKAILSYEVLRLVKRKAVAFMAAMAILPVLGALIASLIASREIGGERLWAVLMGFDLGTGAMTGLLAAVGVAGWAWLLGVVIGGDLFASDIRDGSLQLFMLRPARRVYPIAKMAAAGLFSIAFYTVASLIVLISSIILGGWQRDWWLAPLTGFILGVGLYPVILTSSIFGIVTRSPIAGMILGAAAYLLTGMAVSFGLSIILIVGGIANIEAWISFIEKEILVSGAIPYLAGTNLPSIIYYAVTLGNSFTPIPLPAVGGSGQVTITLELKPLDVLPLYTASLVIGTLALAAINLALLRRLEV